jgi:phosphatidylserine decarboxylase
MKIRPEILPFIVASALVSAGVYGLLRLVPSVPPVAACWASLVVLIVLCGYLCWFFRDPVRTSPADPDAILAGADGVVAKIATFTPEQFGSISMLAGLKPEDTAAFRAGEVLRVSIFLSLFDVHVNRVPIAGKSRFLGYFPGKHLFTFEEKSSDVNQHNSILIENERTCCLVNQIVGPVCRRVVYWLPHDRATDVKAGDDFGMMKFGSRMDMYFPAADIDLLAKVGDRVTAGVTIIGRYR